MRTALANLLCLALPMGPALAQAAAPKPDVTAADIDPRSVARTLAQKVASDFVYPEQGKRYAAALLAAADAGTYDSLRGVDLARKLGEDLQRVARDGHLRVMYQGVGGGGGPQIVVKRPPDAGGATPPPGPAPRIIHMTPPPAIEKAQWLAPGIAFVRFNLFPGGPEATAAVQRFMDTYAGAKTIIFDLRMHMGGGLDEMDVIFPRLFAKPTRLVAMATRKSVDDAGGSPIASQASLRIAQGDPDFVTREHWATPSRDRRLNKARVYVLTSGFSASAAEHFALAFKHTGRGTLIGRTTYGANHFGGDQDLGGNFTAFIPLGRAYDPVTGKDWEGVGIVPDIETAPEDALTKALTLSGLPPARAADLSRSVAPTGPMAAAAMSAARP